MIEINPLDQSERDNYKLMIGSIIPRPIAFVTTKSKEGIVNAAPFSYFNVVSSNPPLISVSIQHKDNLSKDTSRNIFDTKEFVVHIVDSDNVEGVNQTAANLDYNHSEIDLTNFTLTDSSMIDVPGIKQSKIRMECILEETLTNRNNDYNFDLIIGKIVYFHIDENIYEDGKINPIKLDPISRLAGNSYAKIGEIFDLERPK